MPPRYINPKSRKYKIKELIMDEGSICIMDTGVWHKAEESSINSRWSIFSIYTGWFVKPYYDYSSITNKKINKVYKTVAQILYPTKDKRGKRSHSGKVLN